MEPKQRYERKITKKKSVTKKKPDDEYNSFGEIVSHKLRGIQDPTHRIFIQKSIYNLLIEGEQKQLHRERAPAATGNNAIEGPSTSQQHMRGTPYPTVYSSGSQQPSIYYPPHYMDYDSAGMPSYMNAIPQMALQTQNGIMPIYTPVNRLVPRLNYPPYNARGVPRTIQENTEAGSVIVQPSYDHQSVRSLEEAPNRVSREAVIRATREAEVRAAREAEVRAAREAGVRASWEAEVCAAREAEVRAAKEAEVRACREVEIRAAMEVDIRAARKADIRPAREVEIRATRDAEIHGDRDAEIRASRDAEMRAARDVEMHAARDAEIRAAREEEIRAAREEEIRASRDAEMRAARDVEMHAARDAEIRAAREEEIRADREEEIRAVREVLIRAGREVEIRSGREAEIRPGRELEISAGREVEIRQIQIQLRPKAERFDDESAGEECEYDTNDQVPEVRVVAGPSQDQQTDNQGQPVSSIYSTCKILRRLLNIKEEQIDGDE